MKTFLMSAFAVMAVMTASGAHAAMTDQQRDQCLLVGKALEAHTIDNLNYMVSDEQKGQFSVEDIQQKRDVIQHLHDDFIPMFDVGQAVDPDAVAKKSAEEDSPTLGNEANDCVTLAQQ